MEKGCVVFIVLSGPERKCSGPVQQGFFFIRKKAPVTGQRLNQRKLFLQLLLQLVLHDLIVLHYITILK